MLAIIPARKGSKGLKNKNKLLIAKLPLIAHSIKSAKKSKFISRVIVSTDCKDIARISKKYGAEVPFLRSKNLAQDTSMVMDAYFEVIKKIDNKNRIKNFVALLPTSPLRSYRDIDNAIKLFIKKKADSVISMTEAYYPIDWNHYINKDKRVKAFNSNLDAVSNRQNLKKTFIPNGSIYVFNYDILKKTRKYYHKKTYAYLMPLKKSIDIDNKLDFELAEKHLKGKLK
tara:strand:+ start:3041 stop:3724 length:684 start_codon:yes stop_codon:yes gene_type:complete